VKRAYQIVEELMLLANELVAKWLSKRRCPTVYRVHGKPDETKLERLGEVARALGVEFELADMLAPAGVGKWLASIHDHPRRQVLEMLLLRSLKQAVYDIVNIGHFGLASDNYLHFTSPIRRYPDILVHRAVKSLLHGGKPDVTPAGIEALRASATNASVRERAAMDVEREVVDLYRALYMRDHVGEVYDGTVTTVVGSGLYTTLDHPFIDVLVRYEGLGPDRYEASEDELSVVGVRSGDTVSLGDKIVVTIDDVAVLRRTVYARRVPPDSAGRARKPQVQRAKAAKLGKGARKNQRPARSSGTAERARPRGRTERSQHQGRKRKRS
jgi:ribonuclease R